MDFHVGEDGGKSKKTSVFSIISQVVRKGGRRGRMGWFRTTGRQRFPPSCSPLLPSGHPNPEGREQRPEIHRVAREQSAPPHGEGSDQHIGHGAFRCVSRAFPQDLALPCAVGRQQDVVIEGGIRSDAERAAYEALLEKKRPDLDAEKALAELDKFNSPRKEKAALHWTILGTIQLPQDDYKVEDALSVAAKAKVDPLKYRSPLGLIESHKNIRPTRKPIDPDTVPELYGKRDEGDGIAIYEVDDSREGQLAMRRIIDTHWGEDANPGCLPAREEPEETYDFGVWRHWKEEETRKAGGSADVYALAFQYELETGKKPHVEGSDLRKAWKWWQLYSALPKLVAFKNGKLLAFMATEGLNEENDPIGDDIGERLPDLQKEYEAWPESEEGQAEPAGFYDWRRVNYPEELEEASTWEECWDWQDESHPGLEWAREDGKRFMIVSMGGRHVAVADTEPLTTSEAQDEAKVIEVLRQIVGKQFVQKGEEKLVEVNGNIPEYFWHSNTSEGLRKVDKLWCAKVSAVPILGDILATTLLGPREAAEHLKKDRSFKDRAVFYRCATEFGIKRYDGVAIYPCNLLIMEMKDNGSRYVFDYRENEEADPYGQKRPFQRGREPALRAASHRGFGNESNPTTIRPRRQVRKRPALKQGAPPAGGMRRGSRRRGRRGRRT